MLKVVVPVDFSRNQLIIMKNITRLIRELSNISELYFVINARGKILPRILRNQLRNANVIKCDYTGPVNRAKLRNIALTKIQGKVFLCDIDLVVTKEILDYAEKILESDTFVMFPCLYRQKNGISKNSSGSTLKQLRKVYTHLAIPSSVVGFINNGIKFDENFVGHGYEDFDFIIRYLISTNKYNLTKEDLLDESYEVPALVRGFRLKLAHFALETLKNGLIAEHIYHKRETGYSIERERNRSYFLKKISELGASSDIKALPIVQYSDSYNSFPLNLLFL